MNRHITTLILSCVAGICAAQSLVGVNPAIHLARKPPGKGVLILFIETDCPICNAYAKEIERIVDRYRPLGIACRLAYEDEAVSDRKLLHHAGQYGHKGCPIVADGRHKLARLLGATVTPEACVLDARGIVRYRGRIDDLYPSLGVRRIAATKHDLVDAMDAVCRGNRVLVSRTKPVGCFIPEG